MSLLHASGLKSSKKTVGEELAFIVIVLQEFFYFYLCVVPAAYLHSFLSFVLQLQGKTKEPSLILFDKETGTSPSATSSHNVTHPSVEQDTTISPNSGGAHTTFNTGPLCACTKFPPHKHFSKEVLFAHLFCCCKCIYLYRPPFSDSNTTQQINHSSYYATLATQCKILNLNPKY